MHTQIKCMDGDKVNIVHIIIALLIGYAFGCIPSAYVAGKLTKNIDIRQHGSGNSGATNATRVLGKKIGILVFVGDFLKGVIAIAITWLLFKDISYVFAGVGSILGHNYPVQLGFRGGKGVATSIGVIVCITFVPALITIAIGVLVGYFTKYVSVGAIVGAVTYPILVFAFGYRGIIFYFSIIAALMLIYRHKANIQRLLNGTENKIGANKNKQL